MKKNLSLKKVLRSSRRVPLKAIIDEIYINKVWIVTVAGKIPTIEKKKYELACFTQSSAGYCDFFRPQYFNAINSYISNKQMHS